MGNPKVRDDRTAAVLGYFIALLRSFCSQNLQSRLQWTFNAQEPLPLKKEDNMALSAQTSGRLTVAFTVLSCLVGLSHQHAYLAYPESR